MADVPYRFDRTAEAAALQERYAALGAGRGDRRRGPVAGRVMLNRPQGRLAFAKLRDSSGAIQLFATGKTDRRTSRLRPAVPGRLGRGARRGGADPQAASCRSRWTSGSCWPRPGGRFGDKWKGVTDVETRFRQREVDLWANERSRRGPAVAQPA